jgi:elongation factor 1-beta
MWFYRTKLRGEFSMAQVVITLRIMPESVDVNLSKITEQAKIKIIDFAGPGDMKIEEKPIAFGLKAIDIIFIMDESKGSTDSLEDSISEIDGVQSVEVTDVRRAVG